MPTLRGIRRRGIPPLVIRAFRNLIGVQKREGVVDVALFEHMPREQLIGPHRG